MRLGIVELYKGASGKKGFYNNQEIGLAKAMKKLGYECFIFYPISIKRKIEEEKIEDGITTVYVPSFSFGVHSIYDWGILKKYGIEIVQVGSDNQIFAPNVIQYCKKNRIIVYNYIGTLESDSKDKLKKIFMSLLIRRNMKVYNDSKCFVKSQDIKLRLEQKSKMKVELAPVGLDLSIIPKVEEKNDQIKRGLSIPINKRILLFVGRIDQYKNPMEAIELLEKLSDEYWLIMIGTGSLNYILEEKIEKSKCHNRVTWIKKIPNAEIHKFYKICNYYLNFNQNEIFGMSILEAMYQGSTVIAKHGPGPDTIIENGSSGYLVNNNKEIISIIVSGQQLRREIVRNRIVENFVWEHTAEKIDWWVKQSHST